MSKRCPRKYPFALAFLLLAGPALAKTYTIKMAYVVPETQSTHIAAAEVFKPYVEEASEGRIKVELYPNGQLGGDRQLDQFPWRELLRRRLVSEFEFSHAVVSTPSARPT